MRTPTRRIADSLCMARAPQWHVSALMQSNLTWPPLSRPDYLLYFSGLARPAIISRCEQAIEQSGWQEGKRRRRFRYSECLPGPRFCTPHLEPVRSLSPPPAGELLQANRSIGGSRQALATTGSPPHLKASDSFSKVAGCA